MSDVERRNRERLARLLDDPASAAAVAQIVAAMDEHERETRSRRQRDATAGRPRRPRPTSKDGILKRLAEISPERLDVERRRAEIMDETRALILRGREAGIGPTELAASASLTRRAVYDILGKAES